MILLASQMSFAVDGLRYDGTYETDVANGTSVVPVNNNKSGLPAWVKAVIGTGVVITTAIIAGIIYYCFGSSANAPEVVDNHQFWHLEGIVARALTSPERFLVGHRRSQWFRSYPRYCWKISSKK